MTYNPVFLDIADIMAIHKRSHSWAARRYRKMMNWFRMEKHQRLTIYHFCEYEGIPAEKCLEWLTNADKEVK